MDCADRLAGVLLHLTSLPNNRAHGHLGSEAYRFVDFLAASGFSVWQMLPVNPTGADGSPYQSSSAFAGNAEMIDLKPLIERKWLSASVMDTRCNDLRTAWQAFCRNAEDEERQAFSDFMQRHSYWLDDYALFNSLHKEQQKPWWEWPDEIRERTEEGLAEARSRLSDEISCTRYVQYLFFSQWALLKAYANERGVQLFGDMPIFVAHDSAEVWARQHLFDLDEHGHPNVVAGVPPDYFSETGQRWGNPLYRWDVMHSNDYVFWEQRVRNQMELFDIIRIDHFRGFESYWSIPAHEEFAINGSWVPGPGDTLFERLRDHLGELPLVAEDLGVITDEVKALKERQKMPGMKILQFAFSGNTDNPYLPYNHEECSVVYTGTHDNNTTVGWYESLDDGARSFVDRYLGHPDEPMPWPLIRTALSSRSRMAVIPMQDLLELGDESRMNTPGTVEGNWRWRFDWSQVPEDLSEKLRELLQLYGRITH